MTEQQHPITPPPELIRKWDKEAATVPMADQYYIAIQAARWGADQQLNADCEWLHRRCLISGAEELRAAMRPKPLSLAEQALMGLEQTVIMLMPVTGRKKIERFDIIRRALKRLQELEEGQ